MHIRWMAFFYCIEPDYINREKYFMIYFVVGEN